MTLQELSQLYHLKSKREKLHDRVMELRSEAASLSLPRLDGMPRAPSRNESRTERYAVKIADMTTRLAEIEREMIREECRLQRFISGLPDSRTRLILRYRFIDCLTWQQVAKRMGGYTDTEESVKVFFRRFLSAMESERP